MRKMTPQPAVASAGGTRTYSAARRRSFTPSRVELRPDMVIPPRGRWRNNGLMAYVFDPDIVHECSLPSLGLPKPDMFDAFAAAMEGRYPGRLDLDQPWIFSN